MIFTVKHTLLSAAVAAAFIASPVFASAVLTSGNITLGVNDLGNLGPSTDLIYAGAGDAISPGCFCEGWGAAGNGVSGYANFSSGTAGLLLTSFTRTLPQWSDCQVYRLCA